MIKFWWHIANFGQDVCLLRTSLVAIPGLAFLAVDAVIGCVWTMFAFWMIFTLQRLRFVTRDSPQFFWFLLWAALVVLSSFYFSGMGWWLWWETHHGKRPLFDIIKKGFKTAMWFVSASGSYWQDLKRPWDIKYQLWTKTYIRLITYIKGSLMDTLKLKYEVHFKKKKSYKKWTAASF